ncbi:Hypothetical protein D9617_5g068300 [Elsinoe fawcettii]|nr:Hypothetical protein D9617_5g068300 [Elsinoe fawcettii]
MTLSLRAANVSISNAFTATVPFTTDADITCAASSGDEIAYYNTLPAGGLRPISPCSIILNPALAIWVTDSSQPIVGTATMSIDIEGDDNLVAKTCTQAIVDQIRKNATDSALGFGIGGEYGGSLDSDCNFLAFFPGTKSVPATTEAPKTYITRADGVWEKSMLIQIDDGQPQRTLLNLGHAIEIEWSIGSTHVRFSSRFAPEMYYTESWTRPGEGSVWVLPSLAKYFPELGTAVEQCQPVTVGTSANTITLANFATTYVEAATSGVSLPPALPSGEPGGTPQPPGPTATTTPRSSSKTTKTFSTGPSRQPEVGVPEQTLAKPQNPTNPSTRPPDPTSTTRLPRPPPVQESPATRLEPIPILPGPQPPANSPTFGIDPSRIISAINNLSKSPGSSPTSNTAVITPEARLPVRPPLPAIIIGGSSTLLPGSTTTISGHRIVIPTASPAVVVIDSSTVPIADFQKIIALSLPELQSVGIVITTIPTSPKTFVPAVIIEGIRTLLPGAPAATLFGRVISIPTTAPGTSLSQVMVVVDGVSVPMSDLGTYLEAAAPELKGQVVTTEIGVGKRMSDLAGWIMNGLGGAATATSIYAAGNGQERGGSSNGTGVVGFTGGANGLLDMSMSMMGTVLTAGIVALLLL